MDYKHIYLEIIRRAKNEQIIGNRPLNIYYRRREFKDDYFEFHHILPKSLFPKFKNIKKNLVPLTAREHFICHKLLLKIYPGKSMAFALIRLCFKRTDLQFIEISAREYEQIRKNVGYYISKFNKGKTLSNETKLKISEILKEKYKNGDYIPHNKNNSLSDETKNKISNNLKEQYNTGKIEVWNKNKKCPSSIRLKEKNKMYGKHWFTNGNDNIIAEECPEGYKPGKIGNITEEIELKRKRKISENSKGRHWYNNGKINKFCYECPEGFVKGFLDPRWIKMIEIQGKYGIAEVFTDNVCTEAYTQILNIMNQCWARNANIKFMPDVSPGRDALVGTTMKVTDKAVPNLIGPDIGCGMLVAKLKDKFIEFGKLDKVIKEKIPSGKSHNDKKHRYAKEFDEEFEKLIANVKREELLSICSLGSGNHFIEVDKDEDGAFYIVIHSGSRHLGVATCEYWQNIAIKDCADLTAIRGAEISEYKNQGKSDAEIKELMKDYDHFSVPKNLSYLTGEHMQGYLHDMEIVQQFAVMNRAAMLDVIVKEMGFKIVEKFETIHNYIDLKNMILRKGSISAQAGERVIIPMNMRDGSLICVGKGNEDWNYSAPHGAGRLMTRADAKNSISMAEYKDAMKGIFTSCVSSATIDESPMAYKPMQEIITNIEPTCTIEKIIKPVYNFKAAF